jgi:hypothetical protein
MTENDFCFLTATKSGKSARLKTAQPALYPRKGKKYLLGWKINTPCQILKRKKKNY